MGITVYAAVRVLVLLSLVVIPLVAALLLAALLRPVAQLLQRRLPGPLSALLTLLIAAVVLGGLGYLIGLRFARELPSLIEQLVGTVRRLRAALGGAGGGVGQFQLDQLEGTVINWLQRNQSQAVAYLTTGAGYLVEFATLTLLTLFITFFLLYDGERIWGWLRTPLPGPESHRVDLAGRAAWATITGYVRGTAVIASIHGIVIGFVVFLLGVPLALPLGVLVFVGSFIPFIGALVAGGLAILITFGTHGWLAALILLGVLNAESQLEVHLLQPLIVGRYVRLHPLAIGLSFAVGHRACRNRRSDRRSSPRRRHSPGLAGTARRPGSRPPRQAEVVRCPLRRHKLRTPAIREFSPADIAALPQRPLQHRRWRVVQGGDRVRRHNRGHPSHCHDPAVSAAGPGPGEHCPTRPRAHSQPRPWPAAPGPRAAGPSPRATTSPGPPATPTTTAVSVWLSRSTMCSRPTGLSTPTSPAG